MRAGWEFGAEGAAPAQRSRKGSGLLQGKPLNMRSIPAESTSPTGSALEPVAKAASSSPRGIVGPGERRRFCPKPPSQPLLTLAVRKAGPFRICSES